MPVLRDEAGRVTAIVCSRPRQKRCVYCGKPSDKLCDGEIGGGKTCDKPMCGGCAFHVEPDSDYCKMHRPGLEKVEKPKPRAAEPDLIFIARSKYPGKCKEKDCQTRVEVGEPVYWDPETRQVYCQECGELMRETDQ